MISIRAAVALPQVPHGRGTTLRARSSIVGSGRLATMFAASLSTGAAAIHLAVASSHLQPLGDLALGFYWAAIFQAAFAVALLAHPLSRQVARTGVAINLVLIGTWAWSRTIGLPTIPGGPESIGMADATTTVFEVLLVSLLAARIAVRGSGHLDRGPAASLATIAGPVLVAGIALVTLTTSIAVTDGFAGHGHAGGAPHAHRDDDPTLTAPGPIEAPHGHSGTTAH